MGWVGNFFFCLKQSKKIISVRFIVITLIKTIINGVGQTRSFLVKMVKIGSFWGKKWRHRLNFWGGTKIFFLQTVLTIMVLRFIIITLVKTFFNGVNLVKLVHFWWKWSKLGHFGAKMTSYVEIWGKWWNNFHPKSF